MIMDAAIARDADCAVALMKAHLSLTADRVISLVGEGDTASRLPPRQRMGENVRV